MNRIKEVLEEKGMKQNGWLNNWEKVTIWQTVMFRTDSNRDEKCFIKLLKY
jgi:hypothetical protein